MKILVPISKVPDTTAKIEFTDNDTKFKEDGIQFIMNPTDEWYALVRAVELKEQHGGEVVVIHVGDASSDQIIRKALAIGADKAVRVDGTARDAYFVASNIASYAQDKGFDLVITGKETIDYNGFQVGGMLAELMDLPYVALVSKFDADGSSAKMQREIEGGTEECSCSLPMIVSATKGLAEQRIPNMRGIMQARTKPIEIVSTNDIEELTSISSFEKPTGRTACKYVEADNVQELVRLLHEEAKAI